MPKLSQDATGNMDKFKNTAAENDEEYIEDDEWWMNYDSSVPTEDITEQLLEAKNIDEFTKLKKTENFCY